MWSYVWFGFVFVCAFPPTSALEIFDFKQPLDTKEDHYQLGFEIGQRYGHSIRERLNGNVVLQDRVLAYFRNDHNGNQTYHAFYGKHC